MYFTLMLAATVAALSSVDGQLTCGAAKCDPAKNQLMCKYDTASKKSVCADINDCAKNCAAATATCSCCDKFVDDKSCKTYWDGVKMNATQLKCQKDAKTTVECTGVPKFAAMCGLNKKGDQMGCANSDGVCIAKYGKDGCCCKKEICNAKMATCKADQPKTNTTTSMTTANPSGNSTAAPVKTTTKAAGKKTTKAPKKTTMTTTTTTEAGEIDSAASTFAANVVFVVVAAVAAVGA